MVRWVHKVDGLDSLKNLGLSRLNRGSVDKDLGLRRDLKPIGLKRHRHHGWSCLIGVLNRITILWKVRHLRHSTAKGIWRSLHREVPINLSWHLVGKLPSLIRRPSILIATIALIAPIIATAPLSLQGIAAALVSSISVTTRGLRPGKITRCVLQGTYQRSK